MANDNQKQNQIQIEVPTDEMQGRYANLAVISHGPNDIIMTPENAKQLHIALNENIQKYESTFGEITPRQPRRNADNIMDFPLPKGQA